MLSEGLIGQSFRHAISQHLGTGDPSDREFFLVYQFSNAMMLDIDVIGAMLTLCVFS